MSGVKAHALLSASGAERWLNCTPSARLEESFPEVETEYAAEGSLAHEFGELKVRKFIEPMGTRTYNSRLKKLQEKPLYQEEMLRHTDTYLDYVSQIAHIYKTPPYIAVEKKLDYSTYAPEGFGTGDCIIVGGHTLHVIDFKYGKGVPKSAENNPQLRLYALGAYLEYSFLYKIEEVKMTIVQPRLDRISEASMTVNALKIWGELIKPIAQIAFEGKGDFFPGDHCQFCRAKALCRARSEFNMSLEEFNGAKPPLISNEEVGRILARAQNLAAWAKNLEDYALAECINGNEIPGWKAVEGRSSRKFTNVDEAFNILKANGTEEAMLYDREPLSLAKVEELIGKKKFNDLLKSYVSNPPGKPTLAPANDKREAIKRLSAAEIFKNDAFETGNIDIPDELMRNLKVFYGIEPFNTFTNLVKGDAGLMNRIEGQFNAEQILKAKNMLGL